MFVVDGADRLRLPIVARELADLVPTFLAGREIPPLLLLVSKQDVPGAMTADEAGAALGLPQTLARVPYRCSGCSVQQRAALEADIASLLRQNPTSNDVKVRDNQI